MSDGPAAQAGWYPDAYGTPQWWDGANWVPNAIPIPVASSAYQSPPGRIPVFVCGLLATLLVYVWWAAIPLGIIGWVFSFRLLG
ncbi:MAG: hypothetical protein QOK08_443, partial [Actinomycetota bacterium]|nr:hypothetical protein [Actinomycetota bacterium]